MCRLRRARRILEISRTALFNWLWARHNGGQFLLRVEDTDQAREVENGLELIMESCDFWA